MVGFVCSKTKAQTHKIDSLRNKISQNLSLNEKRETLINLCAEFNSLPSDSLLHYIHLADQLCKEGSDESIKVKIYYCIYLQKKSRSEDAIHILDSLSIKISSLKNNEKLRMEIIIAQCGALIRNNENKEAIENAFNLLQLAELQKDTLNAVKAYTFLGWANMELGKYYEAIRFLNTGFHYSNNENILQYESSLFSNNAASLANMLKTDSARYFVELSLKYSRKTENLTSLANALNIRADMFANKHEYVAAENDLKEALEVREKIGDKFFIISDMAQLSVFYANINQTNKGIEIAQEGITIAKELGNTAKLIYLYSALGENYRVAKKYEEYSHALENIVNLKDTLYQNNSEDAIAAIGAKYELQKKENIIIKQKYELIRSRYFTIGTIIVFILCALLIFMFYRNYQLVQKRKMEAIMTEQKKIASEAIIAAEENERKRIAADLHDNLGSYAAAITSNVKYLKEGILNKETIITQLDENARSMVTQLSDTIWVLKNEYLLFTQLADRYKVWMLRLMQNYPDIKYNYSENIAEDVEFAPVKILNIFLILKECINNALKHSKCSDITIAFTSDQTWQITIEDNGIGFTLDKTQKGNGMKNVMDRAFTSGWNVEWLSIAPHGTRVLISGYTTK